MTKGANILAVVLCGGESSRMGQDKGLINVEGEHWVQLAINKLHELGLEIVVSVRAQQCDYYKEVVEHPLIVDNSLLPVGGPLKGLLSVHQQYPDKDLFVLACDMPDVSVDVLSHLLVRWCNGAHAALVFLNDHEPEPLCGLYASGAMDQIAEAVKTSELNRFSMKYVLSFVGATGMPMPADWKACFANYNYPIDVKR